METKIIQQVKNLFAGADERDWQKVESVMNEQVLLDYSSMTGNPAAQLTRKDITNAWSAFLPGFDKTDHQLSGFRVNISNGIAIAHYKGSARHHLNNEVWVVDGDYDTKLKLVNGVWLIAEHKFNFTEQSGNIDLPAVAIEKMKEQK